MPKRVLAIGLGGTGKASLTILKERLIETYGKVPDTVVLLSLDTDDLRDVDNFAGVRLDPQFDKQGREPEFRHVVSPPGITMDTIFADIASGRTAPFMHWLEKEKLERILTQTERDIRGGAQQRRPIGRTALFQKWASPVYESIELAISRMYGNPEDDDPSVDAVDVEKSKRLVFIIGSVAGGTSSGFFIDVANLVRHAIYSNNNWQSIDVSGIIVLPDTFASYTSTMDDPTNLKPNSYAALRELDRFNRVHSNQFPYMIRYGQDTRSITWSTNQPMDHVYLVDTASRNANSDTTLSGNPMRGVFPVVADFVMAHVDQSLGDALATLRSNAGQHYDNGEGRLYSGLNVMTYIFPVDDVIESFTYRFLREMLAEQFLPLRDKKEDAQLEQVAALKEVDGVFSKNSIGGKVNPGVIQKAIAATRYVEPDLPPIDWQGLFGMISLSDSAFAENYQDLDHSLAYLAGNMIPSGEGDYRRESYADGFFRLFNFGEQFMDDFLGPQLDRDDENSRAGGDWDKILSPYREALVLRFAEAIDAALLDILNRRHPENKLLEPARLAYARRVLATLKSRLVRFRTLLEQAYREEQLDKRIRQASEEVLDSIAWMRNTRDQHKSIWLLGKAEAIKAQEAYVGSLAYKMELALHQRVYRAVLDVLDALGAADQDKDGNLSVLDQAMLELEIWQATFGEVFAIIHKWEQRHNENRDTKNKVRVRRYLTDAEFERQLYQMREHWGTVYPRVMGQVRGQKGINWQRTDETEPLQYKLITTWGEEAKGANEIASKFFVGVKELFQVVRDSVTAADRIAEVFNSSSAFTNYSQQVIEPFLRYIPALNGKEMFHERYVSFNVGKANDSARKFLSEAGATLGDNGFNVDNRAESLVACTVVDVARGVALKAVDQFVACEPDYRNKLFKGRESIHLFPEEQVATDYEGRIEGLGDPNNRQRLLSPQLVIAMSDELILKAFTLACGYDLIGPGLLFDEETGAETTEIILRLAINNNERIIPLSQSQIVRQLDPRFASVSPEEQLGRLYLNALQNFNLKVIAKRGVPSEMVATLLDTLNRRGVSMGHIESPLTLHLRDINQALRDFIEQLGPSIEEEPDRRRKEALNARRRVDYHLQPFLINQVAYFTRSPLSPVSDMGTVMQIILQEEIRGLLRYQIDQESPHIASQVSSLMFNYQAVVSLYQTLGRKQKPSNTWNFDEKADPQFYPEQNRYIAQICTNIKHGLKCPVSQPRPWFGFAIAEIDTTPFLHDLFDRPDRGLSPKVPVIFSGWQSFDEEIVSLHLAIKHYRHNQTMAFLILFEEQSVIDRLRPNIVQRMQAYGIDIVVMGRQQLEQIFNSPNPSSSFRSSLLTQIDIARISPYHIFGPVNNDLVFSGRETEIKTIVDKIKSSSFALIAGRRFGKTSMLLRLHRFRIPGIGYRSIYHDCSPTATFSKFMAASLETAADKQSSLTMHDFLANPPAKTVLLLDEADKLIPDAKTNNWELFNLLRALSNAGKMQIVFSGERALREALRDAKSPLFNHANVITLGSLEKNAVAELVVRPMQQLEIHLEEKTKIVEQIWDFTSGHPNVVQRLCQRLLELPDVSAQRILKSDHLEMVINNPHFQREDFLGTYWEAATSLEKIVSLIMVYDNSARTLKSIRSAINAHCNFQPKAREVDNALHLLVDLRALLRMTATGYEFAVESFPKVIARAATMEDMLEILTEEYMEQE